MLQRCRKWSDGRYVRMVKVHILTKGFASPNGIAFLFPLYIHRRRLNDIGISFSCFTGISSRLTDCDVLIIDSRYYSNRWAEHASAAVEEISALVDRIRAVLYFDIADSTGWIQTRVLPLVKRYYKAQLLKDRDAYLKPHYGNRIFTDYYHREFGIEDREPEAGRPVERAADLVKLRVSWNSGLADYSRWGPMRMALRHYLPIDKLLRFPRSFTAARKTRSVAFACRFGTAYSRETVVFQRRRILELLKDRIISTKLPRAAYLEEMRQCRIVISPFGFGEVTLKDFETLLCGAMLLKPDMTHLETWPNLLVGGQTIASHRWDLSDVEAVLDSFLSDDRRREGIAQSGQDCYYHHIASVDGYNEFCRRFQSIVADAQAA